jgi:hypothetical protein
LAGLLTKNAMPAAWYLAPSQPEVYWDPARAAVGGILQFITGLVLYGYLIPISLYVTVEIVKVLQAFNISQVRGSPAPTTRCWDRPGDCCPLVRFCTMTSCPFQDRPPALLLNARGGASTSETSLPARCAVSEQFHSLAQ